MMDFSLPMSEWTEEMVAIFQHERERPALMFNDGLMTLGEPTVAPFVAENSLHGYSLDTTFIHPYGRRVTTLRQQWEQDEVLTGTDTYTQGDVEVIEYQAYVMYGEDTLLTLPITYETYKTLNRETDENGFVQPDDWRAYDDPSIEEHRKEVSWRDDPTITDIEQDMFVEPVLLPEWRATDEQERAIEKSPEVVTEDRMNSLEPARDGAGRIRKFRADTRYPELLDPETGLTYPQPDKP